MDVKQAIMAAKAYVSEVYADETISNLGLEETEYDDTHQQWHITVAFSRPWNTPRSRAQEALENLGGVSALKRSYKIVSLRQDGSVLAMKDRSRLEAAE